MPTTEAWLEAACRDADAKGLPELKPLLQALARSTASLRRADPALANVATKGETT